MKNSNHQVPRVVLDEVERLANGLQDVAERVRGPATRCHARIQRRPALKMIAVLKNAPRSAAMAADTTTGMSLSSTNTCIIRHAPVPMRAQHLHSNAVASGS